MRKYFRAVREQAAHLLLSKGAMATFALLLALVLLSFADNVNEFRGYDRVAMYHPMKMLLLSYNRTFYNASFTLVLIQLVPLVVCLPAGLSLVTEQHSGEIILAVSRLGARTYIWSKLIAAFMTTFIVFTLPFLIEIVLNCLSFPLGAIGDFSNLDTYSPSFEDMTAAYSLSGLYEISPYLYAVVCTFGLGVLAGLLAAVTVAVSAVIKVKYSVTLILPAFLLLEATVYLGLGDGWYDYILFFNNGHGEVSGALVFVLPAAAFTAFGAENILLRDSRRSHSCGRLGYFG